MNTWLGLVGFVLERSHTFLLVTIVRVPLSQVESWFVTLNLSVLKETWPFPLDAS